METKAIDGVSISQLQNKFMTGDELIPVEYDGKNYNINTRDIFNNVSDYNVSVLFPNDGINGDNKDELAGQIGELKTEVAVLKATRPYQDALIQCDIRRVAEHADFNLWRRTCRMISGEVVLPNTPTVTGYASYNPCDCRNNSTQTPAA